MKFLLVDCALGYNVPYNEELVRYVPYLRALDYLKVFSEKRLDSKETADLKNILNKMKENDPKNLNKQGIINLDQFLN